MRRFALSVIYFALFAPAALAQDAVGEPEDKPRLLLNTGGHTAQVRALTFTPDSLRLYSAGLDKIVIGWDIVDPPGRFPPTSINPVQTLRWEISRGLRGAIMEMAIPAGGPDRLLAIGGVGARGHGGHVTVYDAGAGQVRRSVANLQGTLATGGLAFSPDGARFAAVSNYGDLWVWGLPDFKATKLRPYETHNRQAVDRPYRALAFLDDNHLAAAIPFGAPGADQWNIALYDLRRPDRPLVLRKAHRGAVTAIARDPEASDPSRLRWTTASKGGEVFVWTGLTEQEPAQIPTAREPLDVAFGPNNSLFVATRLQPQRDVAGVEAAYLEFWELASLRKADEYVTSTKLDNYACTVSPDGKWVATCGDDDAPVLVFPLRNTRDEPVAQPLSGSGQSPFRLRGGGTAVGKVAFAQTDRGEYQIGFGPVEQSGRSQDFNNYGSPQRVFDLTAGRLAGDDAPLPKFRSPRHAGPTAERTWSVAAVDESRRLVLTRPAGNHRCTITLDPKTQGQATCYCFLADGDRAYALAVGTNHQNGVFVYQLVSGGECPLLRYYRDHSYVVTSLSVSADRQYLASGSLDQTIKLWSLDGLRSWEHEIEPARSRKFKHVAAWGADFARQGKHLVAAKVKPAGIAYARGLREGDILDTVLRAEAGTTKAYRGADSILGAINAATLFEELTIKVDRRGRVQTLPQMVPAWEPVATLFVDRGNEWALFTPQGPFQTSVQGDLFFGWQFNQGPNATPDFVVGGQIRGELERPEELQDLFQPSAANLLEAQIADLANKQDAIRLAANQRPLVTVLSPRNGNSVAGDAVSIQARVLYPSGATSSEYEVFASLNGGDVGRPIGRRVESQQPLIETIEWSAVPSERYSRISVQAQKKGDLLTAPFDQQFVTIRADVAAVRPKLHVLAIAADKYPKGRLELPYPVDDAYALVRELRARSAELYDWGKALPLFNEALTQEHVAAKIEEFAATLRECARPGDLLVVYISGHGVLCRGKYFFVPPDQRLAAIDNRGQDLIEQVGLSWESLRPLRETPCRKLVLLDTCHSGNAVLQSDSLRHHKAFTRPLSQAEMLVVSATRPGQEARGVAGQGGFFTQTLRDGLKGYADGFAADANSRDQARDESVDALELVRYVTAEVPRRTQTIQPHTPMHSPEQLFQALYIPLTKYDPAELRRAPTGPAPAQSSTAANPK